MVDEQMYADPDYATKGRTAFHTNAENLNTNGNVGAVDSPSSRLYTGA